MVVVLVVWQKATFNSPVLSQATVSLLGKLSGCLPVINSVHTVQMTVERIS
jgi:hypothetical protein